MLIVFSGLDGAGKSTQIAHLIEYLSQNGHRPQYFWSRGGYTPIFSILKGSLRKLSSGRALPPPGHSSGRTKAFSRPLVRKLWLTIAILDLMLMYGICLRLIQLLGRVVICDRYLWDTLIDFRLNFPEESMETWLVWRMLVQVTPVPDVAFLLLTPVQESVRRSKLKFEPFPDAPEVLARRLDMYRQFIEEGYGYELDGLRPKSDLIQEIQEIVAIQFSKSSKTAV
jgi:thymidylate kinase